MLDMSAIFPALDADRRQTIENAPRRLLAVNASIDYKDALKADDPRYVPTGSARAEHFERKFYRAFGLDMRSGEFQPVAEGKHVLFFGHVGCGKSTELTRLSAELNRPDRYWVLKVDLLEILDPSNITYSDVWLAVAQRLVSELDAQNIIVDDVALNRLRNWFSEQVLTHERVRDWQASAKLEIEAKLPSIPYLSKMLAGLTASIKTGSTHRETLRTVVRNTYGEFSAALSQVLLAARSAIQGTGKGKQILVVMDGSDRFRRDDWNTLFVDEVNQLTMVRCVAVYTVPMALKSSGARLDNFDPLVLPMIKLHDFDGRQLPRAVAYDALRQVILSRCHPDLFDSVETLDALIKYSGGHLRDALRLLSYACVEAEDPPMNRAVVEAAAKRLAGDYRDWLEAAHYPVLVAAARDPENTGRSDLITRLVDGGALLEYNSGTWREPHPVVKMLAGYRNAQAVLDKADAPPVFHA